MTLPSPSELRALADAAEQGGLSGWEPRSRVVTADARLIALAPDLARRVADLSEWAERARDWIAGEADFRGSITADEIALLARLDEIRGQA